ncbi:SWIM zinc finger family protein [Ophiocordyceps sinensis CO18]|uniref:SWIM zinc finger family protein n=1 Tax=Ophiocordyceps sinensis (strain Co18 / CGMCC 3.14243) TaxID=911162 RepID=T5AI08_OPHSC|nr:SWIM zinc finger family protein [Ophiocordyceps sinensis CO18]
MAPQAYSQSREAFQTTPGSPSDYVGDSSSNSEAEDERPAAEDDDDSTTLQSPAGLLYNLDQLPEGKRAAVRDAFREPPQISLQHCRRIDDTYAFQMSEVVTTSVRIRSPESNSPRMSCSCGEQDAPCRHLVWLMDQVMSQTLYGHNRTKPLIMATDGHAVEMGDPFQVMARHHLAVLAEGLHCQVIPTTAYSDQDEPDPHRLVESRELLSSIHGVNPEDFRPDLFARVSPSQHVLRNHDLEHTVLRMLLDNPVFFQYFLSLSCSTDPIRDPFRKLFQRVDCVLRHLDEYSSKHSSSSLMAGPSPETPSDVSWAATHFVGIVELIRAAIYARDSPLQPHEAMSAARTLVHILNVVVARNRDAPAGPSRVTRNLYLRLVGDLDRDFVIAELDLIPEAASHFLHSLEDINDKIGIHGAPTSYVDKLRTLLGRLRTSSLKRHGHAQRAQPESKRMK